MGDTRTRRSLRTTVLAIIGVAMVVTRPGSDAAARDLTHERPTSATVFEEALPGHNTTRSESVRRRRIRPDRARDPVIPEHVEAVLGGTGRVEPAFGEWLRLQLRMRRVSQRQLARRTGVSNSTISRLVHGARSPNWETATRLISGLNGSPYHGIILPTNIPATSRVEYALRADELLSDDQVAAVMRLYLAMRRNGAVGPASVDGMNEIRSTPEGMDGLGPPHGGSRRPSHRG